MAKEKKDDSLECGAILWLIGMLVLGTVYIMWQLIVGNPEVTLAVFSGIVFLLGVFAIIFTPILIGYWAVCILAGKETADIFIDGMNRKV